MAVTFSDLADAVGQANLDRYFDDDGDGQADDELVQRFIKRGLATAGSYALNAWTQDRLAALSEDELFKMHVAWCAIHLRARSKTEWRDGQGNAPFSAEYKDAVTYFKALQSGDQRNMNEAQTGAPATVGGHLNSDATGGRQPPTFVFAAHPNKPLGSGGF